jgi:hypothetical protein
MGFLIVDISPPSIVGIPAFAVAPDLTRFVACRQWRVWVKLGLACQRTRRPLL